jgi:hypothetical protein
MPRLDVADGGHASRFLRSLDPTMPNVRPLLASDVPAVRDLLVGTFTARGDEADLLLGWPADADRIAAVALV